MEKILTISVAAYNAEKWLKRCLDSFVVPEILDDLDVIIVNDGSKDNTVGVAAEYVKKYPGSFRIINKENGGLGSTYNTSIQAATGKYFKTVDADDWVEKDGLKELVFLLRQTDVDAVMSPFYRVNAKNYSKALAKETDFHQNNCNKIIPVEDLPITSSLAMHALTFNTEILKGYYTAADEKCFYVDVEYCVFYFYFVRTVYVSSIPVYDYLLGTAGQSMNLNNMVRLREQHLRVCRRLLGYYSDVLKSSPLKNTIEACVITQYRVLLAIPDVKESLSELLEFDSSLKKREDNVYEAAVRAGIQAKKETALIICFLRCIHFRGYRIWHHFLKA